MFVVGISVLIYGVIKDKSSLIAFSLGETGIIAWPITRLIQLHREKVALSVIPAIASLLSPGDAAHEIDLLVKRLLDKS